eukprot:11067645-Lingulodinium_polyedra.AAC.1
MPPNETCAGQDSMSPNARARPARLLEPAMTPQITDCRRLRSEMRQTYNRLNAETTTINIT